MRFELPLLTFAACLSIGSAQASALNKTSVFSYEGSAPATILDNVPLMKGLHPETDGNFVRLLSNEGDEKPLVALGIVDVDEVYNYYKRSLPPLGWVPISGRAYTRSDKILHIDAHANGKTSTVTFTEEKVVP